MTDVSFDDLIPAGKPKAQASTNLGDVSFDDLVPHKADFSNVTGYAVRVPDANPAHRQAVHATTALGDMAVASPAPKQEVSALDSYTRQTRAAIDRTVGTLNLLGVPFAKGYDAVHGMVSGKTETGAQDYFIGHTVDPEFREAQELDIDPNTEHQSFGGKVAGAVGAFLPDFLAMAATGGESAPAEALVKPVVERSTLRAVGEGVGHAVEHSAKASLVPGGRAGAERAIKHQDDNPLAALGDLATGYEQTTAANALPLAAEAPAGASLLRRVLTKAATGAVAMPAVSGTMAQLEGTPYGLDQMGVDATLGGLMAQLGGDAPAPHDYTERGGAAPEPSAPSNKIKLKPVSQFLTSDQAREGAQHRIATLEAKTGAPEPDQPILDGQGNVTGMKPGQGNFSTITPAEEAELDFLKRNAHDPHALAEAYGFGIDDGPKDEREADARHQRTADALKRNADTLNPAPAPKADEAPVHAPEALGDIATEHEAPKPAERAHAPAPENLGDIAHPESAPAGLPPTPDHAEPTAQNQTTAEAVQSPEPAAGSRGPGGDLPRPATDATHQKAVVAVNNLINGTKRYGDRFKPALADVQAGRYRQALDSIEKVAAEIHPELKPDEQFGGGIDRQIRDSLANWLPEARAQIGGMAAHRGEAPEQQQAPEPAAPAATGRLFQRGNGRNNSSAQALQTHDGRWYVRHRKAGQWQPWEPRDTFDPSPTFGYRETGMAGGSVHVPGHGRFPVAKAERETRTADFNPLLDLIAHAGGIRKDEARRFGVDPEGMKQRRGIRPLFSDKGVPLDRLREMLLDDGYLPPEPENAPPRIDHNDVWDLVDRALSGKPVAPMGDHRMLDHLQAQHEASQGPEPESTDADHAPDDELAIWFDDASPHDPIQPGDEAEAVRIAQLAERAAQAGADDFDIARFAGESDASYADRLWDLINQHEGAAGGPDQPAETGDLREGLHGREGGQEAPVPEGRDADGFALRSDAPAPAQHAPEVRASQGGLFAPPTRGEQVRAASEAKDAERNGQAGSGRTDMLAGDGELFAGNRPDQARVDDASVADTIRTAFRDATADGYSLGTSVPVEVTINGRPRRFLARQKSLSNGRKPAPIELRTVEFKRIVRGNEPDWYVNTYRLDGNGELKEVGLPREATDFERKFAEDQTQHGDGNGGPRKNVEHEGDDPMVRLARAQRALSAERAKPKAEQDPARISALNAEVERAQADAGHGQELTRDDLAPHEQEALDRAQNGSLAREKAAALSRAQGEADAHARGFPEAIRKVLGDQADRVEFVRDYAGLPDELRDGVESRNTERNGKVLTAAVYDPASQRVFIVTSVVKTPDRAVWNALHEIAGHDGLRKLLGPKLDHALQIALQNPTVKALADAIARDRNLRGDQRMLAAEEALAELAAAVGSGDFDHIASRYGIDVPEGMRERVGQSIQNFLRRLRAMLDDLFGRPAFTDEDVRALLDAAREASKGDGKGSVDADRPFLEQFGGEQAQSADHFSLDRAKAMIDAHRSPDAVRRETGWFTGHDGRWRFEISDEDAHWKNTATGLDDLAPLARELAPLVTETHVGGGSGWDRVESDHPEFVAEWGHRRATGRTKSEAFASLVREVARERGLVRGFDIADVKREATYPLEDVLDHPRLFAAYPQLRRYPVTFDARTDSNGAFDPDWREIKVGIRSDKEKMLSTLQHEIQHAIQHIEGFATGGNTDESFVKAIRSSLKYTTENEKIRLSKWLFGEGSEKVATAEQAASVYRHALMWDAAERLLSYSQRESPSGVFRLIRNEVQWLYEPEFRGNREAADVQSMFYNLPRRGPKRNAAIEHLAHTAARVIRDAVPADLREKFKEDPRTRRAMIESLARSRRKADAALAPKRDMERNIEALSRVERGHEFSTGFEMYRHLAGEVEARNTQARLPLTEEQRRDTPPSQTQDVDPGKVIVIFGGLEVHAPKQMASIDAPASDQTETPEFRRWFGNSKAVDEQGNPLVVYRGGKARTTFKAGGFFAYDRDLAQDYAGEGGRVESFYLSLQKPLMLSTGEQVRDAWEQSGALGGGRFHGGDESAQAKLRQWAMRQGYDGIMVEPSAFDGEVGYEWAGGTFGEPQLIAFHPEQIKSATGNSGAFDPSKRSILENVEPATGERDHDAFAPAEKPIAPAADLPSRRPGESQADYARRLANRGSDEIREAQADAKRMRKIGRANFRAMLAKQARMADVADTVFHEYRALFDKTDRQALLDGIDEWETGRKVSNPDMRRFFDLMDGMMSDRIDRLRAAKPGALKELVENYFPHIWEDTSKAASWYAGNTKRPLDGNKSFLKQRTWGTIKEGMASGLRPVSYNPVDLALAKLGQMDKFITFHEFKNDLKDRGWLKKVKAGERLPDGYALIDSPAFKGEHAFTDSEGNAHTAHWNWAVPELLAKDVNNYLGPSLYRFGAWKALRYVQNVLMSTRLGFSMFHAGFTTLDNAVTHGSIGLNRLLQGDVAGALKELAYLPVSPLAAPFEGGQLNKAWRGKVLADLHTQALLTALEQGGASRLQSTGQADFNNALGSIARKIRRLQAPGAARDVEAGLRALLAGPKSDAAKIASKAAIKQASELLGAVGELSSWLIHQKLVPAQKMNARVALLKFELDRFASRLGKERGDYAGIIEAMHPDALKQISSRVVDDIDFRLGQMNYDNRFWPKVAREISQAAIGAVGWQFGTAVTVTGGVRDLQRVVSPEPLVAPLDKGGKITDAHMGRITNRVTNLLTLALVMGGSSVISQLLMSGQPPEQAEDFFFPRTGRKNDDDSDERLQFPSYWMDHYKLATHPLQTAEHKIHPSIGMALEVLHNRDYYGVQIRDEDAGWLDQAKQVGEYVGKGFVPYSITGQGKLAKSDASLSQRVGNFFGFTTAPASVSRTPFQAFVADKASASMPQGARTQEKAAHASRMHDVEAALRRGEHPDTGDLSEKEIANAQKAAGELVPTIRFKRLGLEDKLRAWDLATPKERVRYKLRGLIPMGKKLDDQIANLPSEDQEAAREAAMRIRTGPPEGY